MTQWLSVNSLLADSDIWSELLSLIVLFILFGLPAIVKGLAESSKKKTIQSGQGADTDRGDKAYLTRIQAQRTQRRQEFQSDWDRRQEMTRQRLARRSESRQNLPPQRPPRQTAAPMPREETLPVAMPLHEEPQTTAPPIRPVQQPVRPPILEYPVVKPVKPVPVTTAPHQEPLRHHVSPTSRLRQPAVVRQPSSVLDRIIRRSEPYKAAVILKEILDRPKAFKTEFEF